MDISKIELILKKYGITEPINKWIKLPQVSIIFLNQDANIFIGKNMIFFFSKADSMLYISENYDYINKKTLNENLEDYRITSSFDLKDIKGFISTTEIGPYGLCNNRVF